MAQAAAEPPCRRPPPEFEPTDEEGGMQGTASMDSAGSEPCKLGTGSRRMARVLALGDSWFPGFLTGFPSCVPCFAPRFADERPCVAGLTACLQGLLGRKPPRTPQLSRRARGRKATPINDAVRESFKRRTSHSSEALHLGALRLNYDPARSIGKTYKKVARLGGGAFGTVFHVQSTSTGQDRAMKVLPKTQVSADSKFVQTEIELMLHLDHPNVVKFYESFEEAKYICIVTELCNRGDFNKLRHGKCSEEDMRVLYRDVMMGVAYCHNLGIAHRDLKFDNCLLSEGVHRRVGKVIDFGLSAIRQEGNHDEWLNEPCGTCIFVAPEVINNALYGVKVDMWALGVMLYNFLTDRFPFARDGEKVKTKRLLRDICHAELTFEHLEACAAEPCAKELVRQLLVRDPAERLDAAAALKHEWLSSSPGVCFRGFFKKAGPECLLQRLTSFADLSRFEKVALMVAAQQATHAEVEDMRAAFLALDSSAQGTLSREDLRKGFASCGHQLSEDELEAVFRSLDVDQNERVSWVEWLSATLSSDTIASEYSAKEVFNFFDADGSQSISEAELQRVVGEEEANIILHDPGSPSNKKADLCWDEFHCLFQRVAHRRCDSNFSGRRRPPCLAHKVL
mmetsp:Transcript_181/g.736  ORF Transcript_181/g.736 Transcript_181/m.736 type:complete len:624 (+) Transcript_181:3-1874(+)